MDHTVKGNGSLPLPNAREEGDAQVHSRLSLEEECGIQQSETAEQIPHPAYGMYSTTDRIDKEKGEGEDAAVREENNKTNGRPDSFCGWMKLLIVTPWVNYFNNLFPRPSKLDYGLSFWNPLHYFRKWAGALRGSDPVPPNFVLVFLAWLGSFSGIWLVGILQEEYFTSQDLTLIVGSFGASAVLIYAAPSSPLAQPRNLVGGHTLSATVGILCFYYWPGYPLESISRAAAVSFAIVGMQLTGTLHPPAAATALIAAIGGTAVENTGWLFIPLVAMGTVILLIVALITNNLADCSQYPVYWW